MSGSVREEECDACGGEGSWPHTFDDGRDAVRAMVECASCDGKGRVDLARDRIAGDAPMQRG